MKKWIVSMTMIVMLFVSGCNYLWSSGKDDVNNVKAITNYADQLNAQATTYKNAIDITETYLAAGGVLDANAVAKYIHLKKEIEKIQIQATAIAASIRAGDYSVGTPRIITGLEIAKQTNEAIPGPWQLPIAGLLTLITGFATWYAKSKAAEVAQKEIEAKLATSTLSNIVKSVDSVSSTAYDEVTDIVKTLNTDAQTNLITSLKLAIPEGFEITKIADTTAKL
jgi:hypothetical protein